MQGKLSNVGVSLAQSSNSGTVPVVSDTDTDSVISRSSSRSTSSILTSASQSGSYSSNLRQPTISESFSEIRSYERKNNNFYNYLNI